MIYNVCLQRASSRAGRRTTPASAPTRSAPPRDSVQNKLQALMWRFSVFRELLWWFAVFLALLWRFAAYPEKNKRFYGACSLLEQEQEQGQAPPWRFAVFLEKASRISDAPRPPHGRAPPGTQTPSVESGNAFPLQLIACEFRRQTRIHSPRPCAADVTALQSGHDCSF